MFALIPDVAFDAQSHRCHVRFVSHAHADHLPPRADPVLVASAATIQFLSILRPKLQFGTVIPIRAGETILVSMPNPPALSVTAYDAQHCSGSLMFLVETSDSRVLYTGDTRIEPGKEEHLTSAKGVDVLAADATFFHPRWKFPSRVDAIGQVLQLIRTHSPEKGRVYIEADMLGCEILMEAVARAYRYPVHIVDRTRYALFASIESLRPHLTDEPAASRFHFCQFQSLAFHVQQRTHKNQDALYIRPSAQWFGLQGQPGEVVLGNDGPLLRDGVWHVLFSTHCSHSELSALVRFIRPRSVFPLILSSTPPNAVQQSLSELLDPQPPAAASASSLSSSQPLAPVSASAPLLSVGLLPEVKTLGQRSSSAEGKRMRLHVDDDEDDIEAFISSAKRGRAESPPRLI